MIQKKDILINQCDSLRVMRKYSFVLSQFSWFIFWRAFNGFGWQADVVLQVTVSIIKDKMADDRRDFNVMRVDVLKKMLTGNSEQGVPWMGV